MARVRRRAPAVQPNGSSHTRRTVDRKRDRSFGESFECFIPGDQHCGNSLERLSRRLNEDMIYSLQSSTTHHSGPPKLFSAPWRNSSREAVLTNRLLTCAAGLARPCTCCSLCARSGSWAWILARGCWKSDTQRESTVQVMNDSPGCALMPEPYRSGLSSIWQSALGHLDTSGAVTSPASSSRWHERYGRGGNSLR